MGRKFLWFPQDGKFPKLGKFPNLGNFPGIPVREIPGREKFEAIREGGNGNFPLNIPAHEPLPSITGGGHGLQGSPLVLHPYHNEPTAQHHGAPTYGTQDQAHVPFPTMVRVQCPPLSGMQHYAGMMVQHSRQPNRHGVCGIKHREQNEYYPAYTYTPG